MQEGTSDHPSVPNSRAIAVGSRPARGRCVISDVETNLHGFVINHVG
jgi:hypothetical protein